MNELIYTQRATKREHGNAGLIYLHVWSTGHQYLIFRDRAHAEKFAKAETDHGRETSVSHH